MTTAADRISVRRVADDHEVAALSGFGQKINWMDISPDGAFLAVFFEQEGAGYLEAWQVEPAQKVLRAPAQTAQLSSLISLAFSPDSRCLAYAEPDGVVCLYDLVTRQQARQLGSAPRSVSLVFAPTGRQIAIVDARDRKMVHVIDAEKGETLRSLSHPEMIDDIVWNGGGKWLATACQDFRVYVWNPTVGKLHTVLVGHRARATYVALNAAGDLAASASWDGTLRLWDPANGQPLVNMLVPGIRGALRFSLDGRLLASFYDVPKLGLWEVATGGEYRRWKWNADGNVGPWSVEFSPDGQLLASASWDGVRLWEAPRTEPLAVLPVKDGGSVKFSPDGACLITSGRDGLLEWPILRKAGVDDGIEIGPPKDLIGLRGLLAFSQTRDGNVIAVNQENQLHCFDRKSGTRFALGEHTRLNSLSITPDGHFVATGTWHGRGVKIWEILHAKLVKEFDMRDSTTVAFSPDGKWLITSDGQENRSWSVGDWQPGFRLERDRAGDMPGPIAFSPDGQMLALARSRYLIELVNPLSGAEYATFEAPDPPSLIWLCFSPDGSQLVACSENNLIQVWDLRRIRQQLAEINLDWNLPPFPLAPQPKPKPLQAKVNLGQFKPQR